MIFVIADEIVCPDGYTPDGWDPGTISYLNEYRILDIVVLNPNYAGIYNFDLRQYNLTPGHRYGVQCFMDAVEPPGSLDFFWNSGAVAFTVRNS